MNDSAALQQPLALKEILGLTPETPAQAWLALRGDPNLPGSRFGPSSLKIFTPRLAVATWAGKRVLGARVPIVNLYNHTPTPVAEGWSVRVTRVRDFRGSRLTYDSHNGTDFAIPPGTAVTAAAPGVVVSIRQEFNRGGLKLMIDHGEGLLTSSNHLGRALVAVGDVVTRGQVVALSGYSGLDAVASFPWVAPHVHYNVALGGVLVDPFSDERNVEATPGVASRPLWRGPAGMPLPSHSTAAETFAPTTFLPEQVAALAADLRDTARRDRLLALPGQGALDDTTRRGWELAIEAFTYPTRFTTPEAGRLLFETPPERRAVLDLPFSPDDFTDAVFADTVGLR